MQAASPRFYRIPFCQSQRPSSGTIGPSIEITKAKTMNESQQDKLKALAEHLRTLGTVAVGFSGGVDSTFLAAVCSRELPQTSMLVHLTTPLIGTPEQASFEASALSFGLPVIELHLDPLDNPKVAANPRNRCYHCKRAAFGAIVRAAREHGADTVADGSNADDANDYRPGMQACQELGVRSPLLECGWHKDEERALLREWGYDVWNMPAGACLATRVPCGESLTHEKLDLIRSCEDWLHDQGFRQIRARLRAGTLQVQASPADLHRLEQGESVVRLSQEATEVFRSFGAQDIDPAVVPYAHGSMNN